LHDLRLIVRKPGKWNDSAAAAGLARLYLNYALFLAKRACARAAKQLADWPVLGKLFT